MSDTPPKNPPSRPSRPPRPYILPEREMSRVADNMPGFVEGTLEGMRDTGRLLLALRYIGAILCYLAGWVVLLIWTNNTYPDFFLFTLSISLLITGFLLGYESS